MDTELLEGLAGEVAQQLARMRSELRREVAAQLAEQIDVVQRGHSVEAAALRERLAEADHRHELAQRDLEALRAAIPAADEQARTLEARLAELVQTQRAGLQRELVEQLGGVTRAAAEESAVLRARLGETDHRLELAQCELETLHAMAADPVVAFTRDAAGAVSLIQRNGPPRPLPLLDLEAVARAAVDALGAALREELLGEAQAAVARSLELFYNPPAWSEATVYMDGQIVQTDVGRTYRVRKGIRATIGRFPGDDAEHWERLGTGGFRVLKSRPETLEPGDLFTEHDARFLHDGRATILFVPKAAKTSDIERAVKAPHGLAQATQAELREHIAHMAAVLADVQRSTTAANDAGEVSVQALAAVERMQAHIDALERRLDELIAASGGRA